MQMRLIYFPEIALHPNASIKAAQYHSLYIVVLDIAVILYLCNYIAY